MTEFVLSFIFMLIAFVGLAVGILLGRAPIKGSCGGVNQQPGASCACHTPCETKRRRLKQQEQNS